MKLATLLPGVDPDSSEGAMEVSGITADSRAVKPGFVFFALPGTHTNGLRYVGEAIAAGAIAVVSEQPPIAPPAGAAFFTVGDVRVVLAQTAAIWYRDQPATVVAVTGTSGKTSVAEFTRQIFAALGHSAASLGTLGLVKPDGKTYGGLTTPDPLTMHRLLSELAAEGVSHVAMEASSHGLHQRRLDGVLVAAGAFTNLSRDHLDYHPSVEDYLAAKLRLFTTLLQPGEPAVIAADSEIAPRVIAACAERGLKVSSIGIRGETIRLVSAERDGFATQLKFLYQGQSHSLRLPLIGEFQVANALVAAGLALAVGEAAEPVFSAVEQLRGVPGRLELVGVRREAPIFIDYAHKPDALEKALQTLRPLAPRRLLVAFGCGGDRDRGKRPLMGEIANRNADVVVVTDDNPRTENPAQIRAAILARAPKAMEIGDRGMAIAQAVAMLDAGDVLLIAGKGHETGQHVGTLTLPFSDHEAVKMALAGQEVTTGEPLWTGLGLVAPLEARMSGAMPYAVTGVSIDSRTLVAGDLFCAIAGNNSNGHDYVRAAFSRGAAAAVVDEAHADGLRGTGALYVVRETLGALQRLGRAGRERSKARIIAITGSVGKTTTKEALRLVLSQAGETHASVASYNNHWGVPLTLARMRRTARFGVFEIGMNHTGEIMPLTAMVRPHVAIITTIAPVHVEHFTSVEAIADAKAEIFSGLVRGGVAMIHRDLAEYPRLLAHAKSSPAGHVVTFGEDDSSDARLLHAEPQPDGTLVSADILGVQLTYKVAAPGRHFAVNSLAVLLAAKAVGVDLQRAAATLAQFRPLRGRGERWRFATPEGAITVIDESYNANPVSMRAALAVLGETAPIGAGRRVAVLGDMLELGPDEAAMHRDLADALERHEIDLLFAAGPLMRGLYEAVPKAKRGLWGEQSADIQAAVLAAVQGGDVVMIKGSNGSRMGPIVGALKRRFDHAAGHVGSNGPAAVQL
jgi:UDP-N-acetylmuramyl-tripeptide synthetase/UDP-N-acetylmuramoyl-tripeptide--D-alanyl-D-alanine ligase